MARLLVLSLGLCFAVLYPVAPETAPSAGEVSQQRSAVSRTSRPRSSGRTRDYKLPAGTVISVQLRTPIASATSRVDEQVSAALREPIRRDGVELIPSGSVMFGVVADVTPAEPRNPLGRIILGFNVIEHAETGHRAMIASRLVAFEAAVPEPPENTPRRRKAKKVPIDVELPAGQPFTVTLAEPLLIRIPR